MAIPAEVLQRGSGRQLGIFTNSGFRETPGQRVPLDVPVGLLTQEQREGAQRAFLAQPTGGHVYVSFYSSSEVQQLFSSSPRYQVIQQGEQTIVRYIATEPMHQINSSFPDIEGVEIQVTFDREGLQREVIVRRPAESGFASTICRYDYQPHPEPVTVNGSPRNGYALARVTTGILQSGAMSENPMTVDYTYVAPSDEERQAGMQGYYTTHYQPNMRHAVVWGLLPHGESGSNRITVPAINLDTLEVQLRDFPGVSVQRQGNSGTITVDIASRGAFVGELTNTERYTISIRDGRITGWQAYHLPFGAGEDSTFGIEEVKPRIHEYDYYEDTGSLRSHRVIHGEAGAIAEYYNKDGTPSRPREDYTGEELAAAVEFANLITKHDPPLSIERMDAIFFALAINRFNPPQGFLDRLAGGLQFLSEREFDRALERMAGDISRILEGGKGYYVIANDAYGSSPWIIEQLVTRFGVPRPETVYAVYDQDEEGFAPIGSAYDEIPASAPVFIIDDHSITGEQAKRVLEGAVLSGSELSEKINLEYGVRDAAGQARLEALSSVGNRKGWDLRMMLIRATSFGLEEIHSHNPDLSVQLYGGDNTHIAGLEEILKADGIAFLEVVAQRLRDTSTEEFVELSDEIIGEMDALYWTFYTVPDNMPHIFLGDYPPIPALIRPQRFVAPYRK